MKKKKNLPGENSDSSEVFPVDTLGIPILVEVAASAATPDAEEELEIAVDNYDTELKQRDPRPVPDKEISTELPTKIDLAQITDRIAKSVTGKIMTALEPVVREKVNLALRMYEDELLKFANEEGGENRDKDNHQRG